MFYDGKGLTVRNAIVFVLIVIALLVIISWVSDIAGAEEDTPPVEHIMAPLGEGWDDVQIEELDAYFTCDEAPWLCSFQEVEATYSEPAPEPEPAQEQSNEERCYDTWFNSAPDPGGC